MSSNFLILKTISKWILYFKKSKGHHTGLDSFALYNALTIKVLQPYSLLRTFSQILHTIFLKVLSLTFYYLFFPLSGKISLTLKFSLLVLFVLIHYITFHVYSQLSFYQVWNSHLKSITIVGLLLLFWTLRSCYSLHTLHRSFYIVLQFLILGEL